nr:UDP-glycosyltransferase [Paris polyphylla]
MGSDAKNPLHIVFFPLMSPGHMIPMVDMARLFARRGVKSTLVTTPANAANIRAAVDLDSAAGRPIALHVIPFPPPESTKLAAGQENLAAVSTAQFTDFINALFLFRPSIESLLLDLHPDCLVSDSLFPWTADLGTRRIIFHGAGAFPMYVLGKIFQYFPLEKEEFTMEGQPDEIKLYKKGLPEIVDNLMMLQLLGVAEAKSYGVVVNTYREMEPTYVDYYKGTKRAWCVGPVSLLANDGSTDVERGEASTDGERIMGWLGGQAAASVVYMCFGSLCHFSGAQLREIAVGLEASGLPFLWVVRKEADADEIVEKDWMPEGFEQRVEGRGLVVRGWAPQTAVLAHGSVGWFVTHCGWNSLQEAAVAGVPMVTWPLFHEQFLNQELVVEVMGVGVRMWEGFRRNSLGDDKALVTSDEISAVLSKLAAGGEEAEAMRRKAGEYSVAAKKAVAEGGSTHTDITNLIEELEGLRKEK